MRVWTYNKPLARCDTVPSCKLPEPQFHLHIVSAFSVFQGILWEGLSSTLVSLPLKLFSRHIYSLPRLSVFYPSSATASLDDWKGEAAGT